MMKYTGRESRLQTTKESNKERDNEEVLNSIAKTTRDIEKENAQIQRDSANLSLDNQRKTIQKREIDLEIGKKLTDLQAKRLQIEINEPANRKKLLAIDTQIQQLEDERYKKYKEMVGTTKIEELQYDDKIRRNKLELIRLEEQRRRLLHPTYDAYRRIQESMKTSNEMLSDIIVKSRQLIGQGLGDIIYNLTGGFQEQKQEAASLEQTLKELIQERAQLAEKGILSEDEARRFEELNAQISSVKDNIEDLRDPIKNLQEAFKDFAKGVVDSIRKIIEQWIAMQIVTGLFGRFIKPATPEIFSPFYHKASGGILPQIKAFKSFSAGGVTSRPTLALLGDNKSKQEIVIPTENIKSDEVTGYTRSSEQPINVINLFTEDDLLRTMASIKGQRIIVNTIGKDMQNKGVTFRQARV